MTTDITEWVQLEVMVRETSPLSHQDALQVQILSGVHLLVRVQYYKQLLRQEIHCCLVDIGIMFSCIFKKLQGKHILMALLL